MDAHFSGVGQYTLGLLRGMDQILSESSPGPRVRVIIPFEKLSRFQSFGFQNIEPLRLPLPQALMYTLLFAESAPPLDSLLGRGVYLFPNFVSSKLKASPAVVVVHDLAYAIFPEYAEETNARYLNEKVPRVLSNASAVVTISENTRRDLIQHYGLGHEQICIASPAADPRIFYRRKSHEIERVRELYGIKKDYILTLSNLEPRKNLEGLIDAYCLLPRAVSERVSLLLVGSVCWKTDHLVEKILCRAQEGFNITRPASYVLDEHKPALMSGATMLVYPSHYEGFGMPPLEALSCGTPVIASDNSSLPEVVGDAGRLVPSSDTALLSSAIQEVLADLESVTKASVVAGPSQAARFDWRKSAQTILELAAEL